MSLYKRYRMHPATAPYEAVMLPLELWIAITEKLSLAGLAACYSLSKHLSALFGSKLILSWAIKNREAYAARVVSGRVLHQLAKTDPHLPMCLDRLFMDYGALLTGSFFKPFLHLCLEWCVKPTPSRAPNSAEEGVLEIFYERFLPCPEDFDSTEEFDGTEGLSAEMWSLWTTVFERSPDSSLSKEQLKRPQVSLRQYPMASEVAEFAVSGLTVVLVCFDSLDELLKKDTFEVHYPSDAHSAFYMDGGWTFRNEATWYRLVCQKP